MIAAQRRALILEELRREGAGSIVGLADTIGVSSSTIRRDLEFLTEGGYIVRSHGGAVLRERSRTTFEPEQEIGAHVARAAKEAIGAHAAAMVEDGQSVIFDSSSTVLEAAKAVVATGMRLTVCTNDIGTALVLARSDTAQLVVLGGTNRRGSLTTIGDPGVSFLARLHADIAFIGIHSLFDGRLSETSIELSAMKQRMIACAARSVVLVDSSKFRHPAFCEVCDVTAVHTVVTDAGIADADHARLVETGVEVIVVPVG